MTIAPAPHNSNQGPLEHPLVKGVGGGNGSYSPATSDCYHYGVGTGLAMFDLSMDELKSRESRGNNPCEEIPESGSKGFRGQEKDEDEGWLQLSIGGRTCRDRNGRDKRGDSERSILAARGSVELDLLPLGRGNGGASINKLESTSSILSTIRPVTATASLPLLFHHQNVSGGEFWQAIHCQGLVGGTGAPTSFNSSYPSSSSSSMPYATPYLGQQLHLQIGEVDRVAGPCPDMIKIINPPRRPHSGIWFMLLASQKKEKDQPCLPQIPRSFLRIKDGRMTVGLLVKYLVNKLQLNHESEIEITCRRQELQPYLTLQHVRDNIWIPRKNVITTTTASALGSSSSIVNFHSESSTTTTQHLMVLHYSRRRRITTPTVLS